jgi:hypothetical protein
MALFGGVGGYGPPGARWIAVRSSQCARFALRQPASSLLATPQPAVAGNLRFDPGKPY